MTLGQRGLEMGYDPCGIQAQFALAQHQAFDRRYAPSYSGPKICLACRCRRKAEGLGFECKLNPPPHPAVKDDDDCLQFRSSEKAEAAEKKVENKRHGILRKKKQLEVDDFIKAVYEELKKEQKEM